MNLATWNMQGASYSTENKWDTGVMNFFSTGAEMCCLQECGGVPASAILVDNNFGGVDDLQYYTWGTERTNKHILFYPSDPNGKRCNLAIVAINNLPPVGGEIVYPSVGPVWRPALGYQIDVNNFIFSMHCISPNGADANGLLNEIDIVTAGPGNLWVAAGDFNREPGTMAASPFNICPPNNYTYSVNNPNKMIDYGVKNWGPNILGTVQGLIMSDHYPVFFEIV